MSKNTCPIPTRPISPWLGLAGWLVLVCFLLWAPATPLGIARQVHGAQSGPMAQAEVVVKGQVFRVDVADTPFLMARGLGGRKVLEPDAGMLFVYGEKDRHSFWMRGMFIPIDIIWLDNRRVVHIEHQVPPPGVGTPVSRLPTYAPEVPANFVLEIAAGRARALGLKVGDLVSYRFGIR